MGRQGFSLIEILITISIIAILTAVGAGFAGALQKNTRDAQREADLRILQSALQQYYADNNTYPATIPSNGSAFICSSCSSSKTYLNRTPLDPNGTQYFYEAVANISTTGTVCTQASDKCHYYFLCAKMESPISGSSCTAPNVPAGFNFQATPL